MVVCVSFGGWMACTVGLCPIRNAKGMSYMISVCHGGMVSSYIRAVVICLGQHLQSDGDD